MRFPLIICYLSIVLVSVSAASDGEVFQAVAGETTTRKLEITNPSNGLTDELNVSIRSEGKLNAYFADSYSVRKTITVPPGKTTSMAITVIGTPCQKSVCEDNWLYVDAVSQKTGNSASEKFEFTVQPRQGRKVVGEAPALSWQHIVIIMLAGGIVTGIANKRKTGAVTK